MESAAESNKWVNTIDSKSPEVIAKAHRIIASNIYCTLSTCSVDGIPWASPVFFAYDDNLNIYWSSAIASNHSQNIYHNNGRLAVAIFNSSVLEGTGEGLYFYGTASELGAERTPEVMQLLLHRTGKQLIRTPEDYLNESPRRIYQFQPQSAWVTGDRLPVGNPNRLVDTKIQINVADLQLTFDNPS
jgi:uncharacterized protein YhbP (UPF0306 family)